MGLVHASPVRADNKTHGVISLPPPHWGRSVSRRLEKSGGLFSKVRSLCHASRHDCLISVLPDLPYMDANLPPSKALYSGSASLYSL